MIRLMPGPKPSTRNSPGLHVACIAERMSSSCHDRLALLLVHTEQPFQYSRAGCLVGASAARHPRRSTSKAQAAFPALFLEWFAG